MGRTSDFRNGLVIKLDANMYSIEEFQHVKPGKGGAFVRTKLKNISNGAVINRTFRAGEKIEECRIENHKMQYLYSDNDMHHIMHLETYEQMALPTSLTKNIDNLLKEGMEIEVQFHDNNPIGIRIPFFLELEITQTEPGVRGDTVSGANKPATVETGATIQVPLFLNQGDFIKIDTRTLKYIERVKSV